ncbi:hypothetical protein O7632_30980 [Solwaraspora sp. WMMD406]|uniref:hypothetical protein n=1 Tax=Solwaraspora sp. WMMD406 TaxID=3016095 RepID=UPI0024169B86|nr:hypothetical protein [Solwaraspora sp. WMMD406]MDG4768486.1 hypothetical protein [Solwaraspora sp. WMMD406]
MSAVTSQRRLPGGTPRHADDGQTPEEEQRRARSAQQFWSMVVGAPAIVSVLRLVVESGGELQTTLLLAANVNPVNLVAAFVITASRLVSGAMVALFAISAVLTVSVDNDPDRWQDRRPLLVRWKRIVPIWFVIVTILVAAVTWKILYLPLLLPAVAAIFQLSPRRLHDRVAVRVSIVVALLLGYFWLLAPTLADAAAAREWVAMLVLAAPPLLALAVTGPVLPVTVRPLVALGQLAIMIMMIWASYSIATAPVLPRTVTSVEIPTGGLGAATAAAATGDADSGETATGEIDPVQAATDETEAIETEDIRGSVVAVDDVSVVILQERGGIRYVPTDAVVSRVLCPSEEDLPRYRLWVHDLHVEDSLLQALGRKVRPIIPVDAACRASVSP